MPELLFGAGVGMLNNAISNAYTQQGRAENYGYGEATANNATKRTKDLYESLYSPRARVEQLKEAGLSPSLMYGDNGSVGQAGAQGTGAQGPINPYTPIDPLSAAQIRNLNAEADLKEAQADTEKGDNEKGAAAIAQMLADAGAKNAAAKLSEANTILAQWDDMERAATLNASIHKIHMDALRAEHDAMGAFYEAENEGIKWNINKATEQDQIEIVGKQLAIMAAEAHYINAGTRLTNAEVEEIKAENRRRAAEYAVNAKTAEEYRKNLRAESKAIPEELSKVIGK